MAGKERDRRSDNIPGSMELEELLVRGDGGDAGVTGLKVGISDEGGIVGIKWVVEVRVPARIGWRLSDTSNVMKGKGCGRAVR